ncbi:MAG: DUF2497 domain-containing protein [Pseudomonadota bacterium]
MKEILGSIRRSLGVEPEETAEAAADRRAEIDALADTLLKDLSTAEADARDAGGDPWPSLDAFLKTAFEVGVSEPEPEPEPETETETDAAAETTVGAAEEQWRADRPGRRDLKADADADRRAQPPQSRQTPSTAKATPPDVAPEERRANAAVEAPRSDASAPPKQDHRVPLPAVDARPPAPEPGAAAREASAVGERKRAEPSVAARIGAALPELRDAVFSLDGGEANRTRDEAQAELSGAELATEADPTPEPPVIAEAEQASTEPPTEPSLQTSTAAPEPLDAEETERATPRELVVTSQASGPQIAAPAAPDVEDAEEIPDAAPATPSHPVAADRPEAPGDLGLDSEPEPEPVRGEVGPRLPPSPSRPRSRGAPLDPRFGAIVDKIAAQIKALAMQRLERGEHSLNRPPPQPEIAEFLGLTGEQRRRLPGSGPSEESRALAPQPPEPPQGPDVLELTPRMRALGPAEAAERDALLTEASQAAAMRAIEALTDPQGPAARSIFERARARSNLDDGDLDAIAREAVKPMLAEWLNENLPSLVEQIVREEIARVRRSGD